MLIIEGGLRGFRRAALRVPTPSAIAVALYEGVAGGSYLQALAVTLTEVVVGFAIGSICGILLGIAMVQVPLLDRLRLSLRCRPADRAQGRDRAA